jgi:hypothetical protein
MTGIAVGMLINQGKLSLDDPIADHFRDWLPENPDGKLLRLTIRDMLRMATCYRWTTYREGIDENWAKTFFTGTPTHEPGTVFYYDTSCSQVLAALVKRLKRSDGVTLLQEAQHLHGTADILVVHSGDELAHQLLYLHRVLMAEREGRLLGADGADGLDLLAVAAGHGEGQRGDECQEQSNSFHLF